jgi:large subunit ribosomal protein L23
MALFNFHKKEERKKTQLRQEKKVEKKTQKPKVKKNLAANEKKPTISLKPKNLSKVGYKILKAPRITEKATDLLKNNQYVFQVYAGTNKNEIKKAVEGSYGVDVESVNVINIPKKRRRLGKNQGWKGGVKKAVVKLKEGQKIEILPR